jgi:hypothetical protein
VHVDDPLSVVRQRVDAVLGEGDEADRHRDHDGHRDDKLHDELEVVEKAHDRVQVKGPCEGGRGRHA